MVDLYGMHKNKYYFLKGNYLTSTLLKNYFMLILCSPVKTRLSARLTARLTKITFFRCLSRKGTLPIRWYSRLPRHSLKQMTKRHSCAVVLPATKTFVGSALDWSDRRVPTMREVCRLSRPGRKEMGWYENGTRDS